MKTYSISVETDEMLTFLKAFIYEFPKETYLINSIHIDSINRVLRISSTENILNAIKLKNLDILIIE